MITQETTPVQKELLKILQKGIPIEKRPFKTISQKLGISEEEVISMIKELKEQKIIRQISPIYDTKALGYESSLVAFKVKGDIEKTAEEINKHPGVSHNYERTDSFNLWFTIAVPPDSKLGLEKTVNILAERTGTQDFAILKTEKLYKIGVKLDFDNLREKETAPIQQKEIKSYQLTEKDKKIIRVTQKDIPLDREPFKIYGEILGIKEEILIERLKEYQKAGVMRRFAAILYHRKAGFKANGMTVWKVSEDRVDEIGYLLASYRAVSHCYRRTTNEKWQYNLFSMIHAQSKEELESFVKEISEEIRITDYKILYSTREFKKKRINYFSEDFYLWEEGCCDGADFRSDSKN
ncbi:siroheme decarboxylase subunit alpha [Persephonella sp.]